MPTKPRPASRAPRPPKRGSTHLAPPPPAPGADQAARPLDSVVRTLFDVSWNEARTRIQSGKVRVRDVVQTNPLFRVRDPALVTLHMNAPRPRAATLPDGAVVHVDAHVVVVDKPAGISTIPYDEGETGTLDERVRDWLAHHGRHARGGGRPPLGVVHRLDKETSGLLVFTRTWLAKQSLTQQFRDHTVVRRYVAIAMGEVKSQTFRSDLVADRGDGLRGSPKQAHERARGRRGSKSKGDDGRQRAVTHVTALESLPGATLVECRLETGRTHQIRIHLSEAGHPIVGEQVYVRGYRGEIVPGPRMLLHALELGFVHPATEEDVRWEREPPEDFAETLARLRRGLGSA